MDAPTLEPSRPRLDRPVFPGEELASVAEFERVLLGGGVLRVGALLLFFNLLAHSLI